MSSTAVIERPRTIETPAEGTLQRVLGHPGVFIATALILLAIFGGTFLLHPGRTAPTRDPAYYTWRTKALMTEQPQTLLEIEGPFGLFSGGYRIAVPVVAGLLSNLGDLAAMSAVALMMVVVPVLISLLLAGFAYRHRRDPLMWHCVAFGSAGMLLTPPFVGYMDNLLGVFFLAGALWFLTPARDSWAGRVGLALFLVAAGVTHTTTLAIFGLTLGAVAGARFLFGRFTERGLAGRLRATLRADGPMLATALFAALVTYVVWSIGIWGLPQSLAESALVFPYDKDFFMARLGEWVAAVRPLFSVPLMVAGIVGLLAIGRRWVEDDLTRVTIVWLAPLIGTFGFLVGLKYPYYRFFNTTLSWVLLVGVGAFFLLRLFLSTARRGGWARLAFLGAVAVVLILATNISSNLVASNWINPDRGWLTPQKRLNLDLLRGNLQALGDFDRPVVFVGDARPPEIPGLAQIWGITQLNGNVARYGMPEGQIERSYIYQGTLETYLRGEPTTTGDPAYDDMSRASLEEIEEGTEGREPLIVLASVFNENGPNAPIAAGDEPLPEGARDADIWLLHEGRITAASGDTEPVSESASPDQTAAGGSKVGDVARGLLAVLLLLVPGALAARRLLGGRDAGELLGMIPSLSLALLVLTGAVVIAVARSPFSTGLAWVTLVLAAVVGAAAWLAGRRQVPASS